jgi:hypothetical protein
VRTHAALTAQAAAARSTGTPFARRHRTARVMTKHIMGIVT